MSQRTLAHLFGVAASLFLLALFVWPLLAIVWESFARGGGGLRLLASGYYLGRLGFTAGQAALSTLLTVLLALPSALLFARYDFRGKRLLRSAFTLPFVLPSVVAAIGWLALVGPRGVSGLDLRGTLWIVLLAHVFYNYGLVVRIVGAYLEGVGPRLREAAAILGAGPGSTLWRLTLPLARPAILAAAALVFSFSFTSFGVILILAPELATLEVEIYRLSTRLLRLDAAALLALIQLAAVGGVTALYTRWQARMALPLGGPRPPLPQPDARGRALLALNLLLAALLVLSPLLALAGQALWRPGEGLSLANLHALLEAPRTIGFAGAGLALRNSLLFALASAGMALALGLAFAYAVVRGGWRALDAVSLLPLATSAVTLGFGYLIAYPRLVVSPWGVLLAHTLIAFPLVVRSLLPALRALPVDMVGAAQTLGAGPLRTLGRLELPLLAPSLLAGAGLAFAVSLGEFGATLVLSRPELATLPVAIFERLSRPGAANYGAALALALLLLLVTGAIMLLMERFGDGEL
jgi:thiamine transport system permease protein